jgi:hypothetical protein
MLSALRMSSPFSNLRISSGCRELLANKTLSASCANFDFRPISSLSSSFIFCRAASRFTYSCRCSWNATSMVFRYSRSSPLFFSYSFMMFCRKHATSSLSLSSSIAFSSTSDCHTQMLNSVSLACDAFHYTLWHTSTFSPHHNIHSNTWPYELAKKCSRRILSRQFQAFGTIPLTSRGESQNRNLFCGISTYRDCFSCCFCLRRWILQGFSVTVIMVA